MRPHALFVATIGEGVFASADSGPTFRRACDGMDFVECHVRALFADGDSLYLGNEEGVWVSRDRANSWQRLLECEPVWSLHVRGGTLVAGTCPAGLHRSA